MYQYIGSGRTDVVLLGSNVDVLDGPTSVVFKRADNTEFQIDTHAFQMLRRAAHRESSNETENKIQLIKAVRGLTRLDLRDAKGVAEYFMNNFSLAAGNTYGK